MDLGSIFLIMALIVLVGLYVSQPFLNNPAAEEASAGAGMNAGVAETRDNQDQRRSALMAERDRLLNTLQELDFDQQLGKIPAEDYPAQRADLTMRAAAVLRELDQMKPEPLQEDPEDWVEQAVAVRRADADAAAKAGVSNTGVRTSGVKAAPDEVEELIARRRVQRQERSAGFCPKCGKPVQKSDRFCSRCGQTL